MNLLAPPQIPASAPFDSAQRLWLDGYLAGLFALHTVSPTGNVATPATIAKIRVPILYASQSGNSDQLDEVFAEKISATGFDAPVLSADDFAPLGLTREQTLLIVSSTWGEGDPPDNAVDFWNNLSGGDHPRLEQMRFAVLGLGDSDYLDFCALGKRFDTRLEQLGATRMAPRGDCDTDFEETAAALSLLPVMAGLSKLSNVANSGIAGVAAAISSRNRFGNSLRDFASRCNSS